MSTLWKPFNIRKNDHKTLQPIILACRYTALSILLSLLFLAVVSFVLFLVQHPEQIIHIKRSTSHKAPQTSAQQDPNWDGAMAGMNLGAITGGFDPIILAPAASIIGGIMGYQLDQKN